MKSVTQAPVSIENVKKAVYEHFGQNTKIGVITELSEGYYSVAYSIELPGKDYDIILKVAPEKLGHQQIYEQNCIEIEIKFYKIIQNLNPIPDIPMSELLAYSLDDTLIGRKYFITKKFKGKPWSSIKNKLSKAENDSVYFQLGQIQANINAVSGTNFGRLIEHAKFPVKSTSWEITFMGMLKNLFRDSKQFKVKPPITESDLTNHLKQCMDALAEVKEPSLVHWDLWQGNVFIIENEGKWKIEGIIDFERALWGDPLMEVYFRENYLKPEFLRGYKHPILESKNAQIRDCLYGIYLYMIIMIEPNVRQYKFLMKFGFRLFGKKNIKKYLQKLEILLKD
jgi:aminoglycoside phosphotransferase (APT) family kinase protein